MFPYTYYQDYYKQGIFSLSNLQLFVSVSLLSPEDYKVITGQDFPYDVPIYPFVTNANY